MKGSIGAGLHPEWARLPIVLLGCGGIARAAHLPAYRKAGYCVHSVADVDPERASALARDFEIPHWYGAVEDAISAAPPEAVFDVAVPALHLQNVLPLIPRGRSVLLQKPFGVDLGSARSLLATCRDRELRAAVNFQLRYAPAMEGLRKVLCDGTLGEIYDVEISVSVQTPWRLWTFLRSTPRLEILYHSIHYLDLLRSLFGNPESIYARTLGDPQDPELLNTRSAMILSWNRPMLGTVRTNHAHRFGRDYQTAFLKCEGDGGAGLATMGLLLDYPKGAPDTFEINTGGKWKAQEVGGNWMPDAFAGPMRDLLRWTAGSIEQHPTRVADAVLTMALVEAAYASNASACAVRMEDFA